MELLSKRVHAKILRETAKWFEEHPTQWVKYFLRDRVTEGLYGYCVTGAISTLIGRFTPVSGNFTYPSGLTSKFSTKLESELVSYNDHVAGTVQDVIKMLRRRARLLEHGGELS